MHIHQIADSSLFCCRLLVSLISSFYGSITLMLALISFTPCLTTNTLISFYYRCAYTHPKKLFQDKELCKHFVTRRVQRERFNTQAPPTVLRNILILDSFYVEGLWRLPERFFGVRVWKEKQLQHIESRCYVLE